MIETLINTKSDIKNALEQYVEVDCGMIGYADKIRSISKQPNTINVPINTKFTFSTFKSIPQFDTSQWTILSGLFYGCSNLIESPILDFKNCKSMYETFYYCSNLKRIKGLLNIDNITVVDYAFYNCSSLESIPEINATKCRSFYKVIDNCASLVNCGGFIGVGSGMLDVYQDKFMIDIRNTSLSNESIMNIINNLGAFPSSYNPVWPTGYGANGFIILRPDQYDIIPESNKTEATNKKWQFYTAESHVILPWEIE